MRYSARKVTVAKVRKAMPFLNSLIDEAGWHNASRCNIRVLVNEQIELGSPWHDGCCRYTSQGVIENGKEKIKSHYAGCYDTCLNNPAEILGNGIDGRYVKGDAFYAIADSLEYYRSRSIDVYIGVKDYEKLAVAGASLQLESKEV